ncbi:hypothetical protein BJX76DRAFT_330613 [Aspergillus varians]
MNKHYGALYRYEYPQRRATVVLQDENKTHPHMKACIQSDLDATDDQLIRGDLLVLVRLMLSQFKRTIFLPHMVAPILLFSFTGVQHARVIEAYFDGTSLVVRPTKLYDLREKDALAFRTFAQYFFGKAIGLTTVLPES